jgi:hypothetical protein
MKNLKRLPPDTEVIIENNELFIGGLYIATSAEYSKEDHTVTITSDYKDIVKEIDIRDV